MKLHRFAWFTHRYLSYLMFGQLLLWLASGTLFALLPFDDWVKSGDVVAKPKVAMSLEQLAHLPKLSGVSQLSAVQTPHGLALKLHTSAQPHYLLASNGQALPAIQADDIRRFAPSVHRAQAKVLSLRWIDKGATRLGLVDELSGRQAVWQATMDDARQSRFYFDGKSGEFLLARNDYWVWYDLFWRLHIMDYQGGEDFNNWLLRFAAVLGLLFACSGLVLTWHAAKRDWRSQKRSIKSNT